MATVFVSYRSTDHEPAERLATELHAAGHRVWLDTWEITLGDSIVERINAGLEGAAYVIVCYSSAGNDSPWMSREWMSALARQLDGYGVRLLPVLLTGGHPPALLADIKYANVATDWSAGLAELCKALRCPDRS